MIWLCGAHRLEFRMKVIGYYIFTLMYYVYKVFPIKKGKALGVMTHDDGDGSNVSIVCKKLKNRGYQVVFITKTDTDMVRGFRGISTLLRFFFVKPFEVATAGVVLLDNTFLPYAFLKARRGQKVIQLWHGTGTIKKFGQDVNEGKLKVLEARANRNITHLVVNSDGVRELYSKVFAVEPSKVYAIGVPRTDELLKRVKRIKDTGVNVDRELIFDKYGIPKEGKLVLYAPTFRDDEVGSPEVAKWVNQMEESLPEGYYLGIRVHPHILNAVQEGDFRKGVIQMSREKDLNGLLMAADVLVTDYSSIVFDFCVTDKGMVFFPYDLERFSDKGRGFYYEYEEYVPGAIGYTGEDVGRIIKEGRIDVGRSVRFKEENYRFLDGKAVERLIELIER